MQTHASLTSCTTLTQSLSLTHTTHQSHLGGGARVDGGVALRHTKHGLLRQGYIRPRAAEGRVQRPAHQQM